MKTGFEGVLAKLAAAGMMPGFLLDRPNEEEGEDLGAELLADFSITHCYRGADGEIICEEIPPADFFIGDVGRPPFPPPAFND
jgi:hypothetical protein